MVGSYSYFFLNCTGSPMIVGLARRDKLFYCERLEPGEAARVRNKAAGKFAFAVCCRTDDDDAAMPSVGDASHKFWGDDPQEPDVILSGSTGSDAVDAGVDCIWAVDTESEGTRAQAAGRGYLGGEEGDGGGAGTVPAGAVIADGGDADIIVKDDDPRNSMFLMPKFFSLCNAFCVFSGGGSEAIEMHEVHEKVFKSYEPRIKRVARP